LKYLHENGCPWNELSCEGASLYGNLEVLKYLHENGCRWNESSCVCASQFVLELWICNMIVIKTLVCFIKKLRINMNNNYI